MLYNNPPITEAIFDIRINQLLRPDLSVIQQIGENVKSRFPIAQKKFQATGSITFQQETGELKQFGKTDVLGLIFSTDDKHIQLQARLDGFTLNMLKPYSNWDEFSRIAIEMWATYREMLEPKEVTRLALRYINKIMIPATEIFDFDNYLTSMPRIPPSLPQQFAGFYVQSLIPIREGSHYANVVQTMQPIDNGLLPFLLDIDVFTTGLFDKANLLPNFNDLRKMKNEVFESFITDKTRKLFD